MTSTTPVVHQIPVDQIDFSPNISSEAENFFQTDADIARMAARQGMVNYDKGQAIKVSSKVLDMCQGFRIRRRATTTLAQVQDSSIFQEEDQLTSVTAAAGERTEEDKDIANATMFTAESGHIARKIHLQSGKTMKTFYGHTGPVTRVAVYQTYLGQERLVTGSWDKTIKIWDTETKACLATLRGHTDFVKGLAVRTVMVTNKEDPEGEKILGHELFSCSYDGTILHWDLQSFVPFEGGRGGPWKGHVRGINDLCLTIEEDNEQGGEMENGIDQGKEYLYSAGSDGTIRKWDITRGQGRGGHCVHVFQHHATTVYKVIVDSIEIWSASADKTAQRLDLETKKADTKLEHPDFVKSIALAGPYVMTGGRQESIRIWSIGTGKLVKEIKGHFDEVSSLIVIGSTLFSGSLDGTVRRWSLKEKDLVVSSPKDVANSAPSNQVPTEESTSAPVQLSHESCNERKAGMMTEEEERELAELMGSDDDD